MYYFYRLCKEKALITADKAEFSETLPELGKEYERIIKRRHVRIESSAAGHLSYTYGFFRPVVVVASSVEEKERNYILMHELTHIRYCDTLFRGMAFAAVALHFFNPLVYLLFREIRICMELHCDGVVSRSLSKEERVEYGRLLIKQSTKPQTASYATQFTDRNYQIIKERILTIKRGPKRRIFPMLVSVVLLSAVSLIPAITYRVPTVHINDPDAEEFAETKDIIFCDQNSPHYNPADNPFHDYTTDNFVKSDFVFLDSGKKLYVIYRKPKKKCENHEYITGMTAEHKITATGCKLEFYKAKYCTECQTVVKLGLDNTATYTPCIHTKK